MQLFAPWAWARSSRCSATPGLPGVERVPPRVGRSRRASSGWGSRATRPPSRPEGDHLPSPGVSPAYLGVATSSPRAGRLNSRRPPRLGLFVPSSSSSWAGARPGYTGADGVTNWPDGRPRWRSSPAIAVGGMLVGASYTSSACARTWPPASGADRRREEVAAAARPPPAPSATSLSRPSSRDRVVFVL